MLNGYGPLRRFFVAAAIPVFLTFLLAGIWHGAGWTFVVFGVIHGSAMAINHGWHHAKMPKLPDFVGWTLTMLIVVAGLVVSRAPDLATAGQILMAMAGGVPLGEGWVIANEAIRVDSANGVGLITLLLGVALLLPNTQQILSQHKISSDPNEHEKLMVSHWLIWRSGTRWAVASALVLAVGVGLATGETSFVYYQF